MYCGCAPPERCSAWAGNARAPRPADLRQRDPHPRRTAPALRTSPLVTIAEVHGDAAGFGVGLIAACDVAVAVSDAHFWFPEVGIDLAPALVLAWLPRVVGERQAFWLTATGERVAAARAQELGLVNEVVSGAGRAVQGGRRAASLRCAPATPASIARSRTCFERFVRSTRTRHSNSASTDWWSVRYAVASPSPPST